MSAPKGNRFWELRSKHGRDKLFSSPEKMWEAACEYFEWCEDNPLVEVDYRGKDAYEVKLPRMRPFTIQGLCQYLGCGTAYFSNFEANLDKTKKEDQDFSLIVSRIKETIYNQKFSGAAAGFLNANIIARDLGLSDKKDLKHDLPPQLPSVTIRYESNNAENS